MDIRTELLAQIAELEQQRQMLAHGAHNEQARALIAGRIRAAYERLAQMDGEPAVFAPLRAHRQNHVPARPMSFGKALVIFVAVVFVATAFLMQIAGVL